ncbi:MAG: nitrilase-related carbon-nitrogen hydrolase, partial [Alphaproteobacteria bacterium]
MAVIKAGLIQMSLKGDVETDSPDIIKEKMLAAHMPLIEDAARQGVQVLGLQEIFNIPYVCASHDAKWYAAAERVPEGPTIQRMQGVAKEHGMVLVVPIYEEQMAGVYYNTAAVIDADG